MNAKYKVNASNRLFDSTIVLYAYPKLSISAYRYIYFFNVSFSLASIYNLNINNIPFNLLQNPNYIQSNTNHPRLKLEEHNIVPASKASSTSLRSIPSHGFSFGYMDFYESFLMAPPSPINRGSSLRSIKSCFQARRGGLFFRRVQS